MKKLMMVLFMFLFGFSLAACSVDSENRILEGSLEEILEQIYASDELSDDFRDFVENGLTLKEVTKDNVEYHLGKDSIKFDEGIASVPIMSTAAYELTLIRARNGQDIEQLKTDIKTNVDPQKWICAGVDPSNVIVENIGDVVVLIMSNHYAEDLQSAFLSLNEQVE